MSELFGRAKRIAARQAADESKNIEKLRNLSISIAEQKVKATDDLINRLEVLFSELRKKGFQITAKRKTWIDESMVDNPYATEKEYETSKGVQINYSFKGNSGTKRIYIVNNYHKGQPHKVGYNEHNVSYDLMNLGQVEKLIRDIVLNVLVKVEKTGE